MTKVRCIVLNAKPRMSSRFNAEISAGSLMLIESRRVASLLLSHPDEGAWLNSIESENILQKRTPSTARRQARLIRRRLETMNEEAWSLIAKREREVAVQLLLACALKHSALFGDFFVHVYVDRLRRLEVTFGLPQWEAFLEQCTYLDPSVGRWSDSTKVKLFQVMVRMLVEAEFLDSARSRRMTPHPLHPIVRRFLATHGETQLLDCLDRIQ